jgi:hypothetical protein
MSSISRRRSGVIRDITGPPVGRVGSTAILPDRSATLRFRSACRASGFVQSADDAGQVGDLLGQIDGEIASVTADGAYDGEPVYQAAASRQPDPPPDVVIPPRASAVPSTKAGDARRQRDRHVQLVAEKGRMAWQKTTGYGRRSLVETAIGRYKA